MLKSVSNYKLKKVQKYLLIKERENSKYKSNLYFV